MKLFLWLQMVEIMKNKWILFAFINIVIGSILINNAYAIEKNTANMQAMDKITGRVSVINIPVNTVLIFFF